MAISLDSMGSSQTLFFPQERTEAASLFWNLRDTILLPKRSRPTSCEEKDFVEEERGTGSAHLSGRRDSAQEREVDHAAQDLTLV